MPKGGKSDRKQIEKGKRHNPLSADIHNNTYATKKKKKMGSDAPRGPDEDSDEDEHRQEDASFSADLARNSLALDEEEMQEQPAEENGLDGLEDDNLSMADTEVQSVYSEMPEFEVDEAQEAEFNAFMKPKEEGRMLCDIIAEKINAQNREEEMSNMTEELESKFDSSVVKVYRALGRFLSHYKSGKVPKALKLLPHLVEWEDLLVLTHPEQWTPHAMHATTRIFVSNLNEDMTQRFLNAFLLPCIRAWMRENHKLAPQYYWAMLKATFKPKAFIKGFFLPLCEAGDCSLKEALIYGSVLAKKSIPAQTLGVILMKIAELEYSGSNSLFIRLLLDKTKQLPYVVIDSLIQHYKKFIYDDRTLPVLWHQSLLTFVMRYKDDFQKEQIEVMKAVMNKHSHPKITPDSRRELASRIAVLKAEGSM